MKTNQFKKIFAVCSYSENHKEGFSRQCDQRVERFDVK
jgi:hypothetical protein